MKNLLLLLFFLPVVAFSQVDDATITTNINTYIRGKTYNPTLSANLFQQIVDNKFNPFSTTLNFGGTALAGDRTILLKSSSANSSLTITGQGSASHFRSNFLDYSFTLTDSPGISANEVFAIDRGVASTTRLSTYYADNLLLTTGIGNTGASGNISFVTGDASGIGPDANSGNILFNTGARLGAGVRGSIGLFSSSPTFGGGEKVLFFGDDVTDPTTNPSNGFLFYSDASNSSHPTIKIPSGITYDLVGNSLQPATKLIAGSIDTYTRTDAASVITLPSGNILMATNGYPGAVGDTDPARVVGKTSTDGGKTWGAISILISGIGGNSTIIPSLYKRNNNSVFMIVYVRPTSTTSELWKVESNDGGVTFGGAQTKIYDGGGGQYYSPASDRIFKTSTGRLLYPFALNTSPGHLGSTDALATYVGQCLYSDDDGVTWTVAGTTGTHIITSPDGLCVEGGIYTEYNANTFDAPEALIFYFRNRTGVIYAARSTNDGIDWTFGAGGSAIGLNTQNSTTTIKFDIPTRTFYAVYNPFIVAHGYRNTMYLATSKDGLTWGSKIIVDQDFTTTGRQIFEPTIFVNNGLINVFYSKCTTSGCTQIDQWQFSATSSYVQPNGIDHQNSLKIVNYSGVSAGNYITITNDAITDATVGYFLTNQSGTGNIMAPWIKVKTQNGTVGLLTDIQQAADLQGQKWNLTTDGSTAMTKGLFQIKNGSTTVFDLYPNTLLIPSGTTATRPVTSATGLINGVSRYDTDQTLLNFYNGSAWQKVISVADGNYAVGDILVATGTNAFVRVGIGSNTFVLTSNGTTAAWAASAAGTTLYNGDASLTGPRILTGSSTNTLQFAFPSLGTTVTDGAGLYFKNATSATSGNQQISPIVTFEGQGFNPTLSSEVIKWQVYALPIQTAAHPTTSLILQSSVNGSATNGKLVLNSDGAQITALPNGLKILTNSAGVGGLSFNGTAPSASQIIMSGGFSINVAATVSSGTGLTLNGSNTINGTSGALIGIAYNGTFNPTSGTGTFTGHNFQNTVNQTGGANGDVNGVTITNIYTAAGGNVTDLRIKTTNTSIAGTHWGFVVETASTLSGFGLVSPTSTLHSGGSFGAGYVAKTANYTLTSTDYFVDCTSNSFTLTLPTAVGVTGRMYVLKNSGTATTITIATTSSQTIDGAAPGTITTAVPVQLISDGANWKTF